MDWPGRCFLALGDTEMKQQAGGRFIKFLFTYKTNCVSCCTVDLLQYLSTIKKLTVISYKVNKPCIILEMWHWHQKNILEKVITLPWQKAFRNFQMQNFFQVANFGHKSILLRCTTLFVKIALQLLRSLEMQCNIFINVRSKIDLTLIDDLYNRKG